MMAKLKIFNIEINKFEIIGIILAILTIILDIVFLYEHKLFYFILGIAFIISGFPFFLFLVVESRIILQKDRMFLEFSRNIVESVKSGTPISKSILSLQSKDYGVLSPYVRKLSNQISLGIPMKVAFETFARDTESSTISKAINIISESDKAGGQIEDILDSVVKSISQIEKLQKERRNAIYGLIVQGYIIFLIFILIMLVMEFKILPLASISAFGDLDDEFGSNSLEIPGSDLLKGSRASPEELTRPFLWLLTIQGFFTGIIVGKLSEGKFKAGLKHSFILMVLAIMINTGTKAFI